MLREVTWIARWCESRPCLPIENVEKIDTLHLPPHRHGLLVARGGEAAVRVVGRGLGRAQREQECQHAADAQDRLLEEAARERDQLGQAAHDRAQRARGALELRTVLAEQRTQT